MALSPSLLLFDFNLIVNSKWHCFPPRTHSSLASSFSGVGGIVVPLIHSWSLCSCFEFGLNSQILHEPLSLSRQDRLNNCLLGAPTDQFPQLVPYIWDKGSRVLGGYSSADDGNGVMHLGVNRPCSHIGRKQGSITGYFFNGYMSIFCGLFSADCFLF